MDLGVQRQSGVLFNKTDKAGLGGKEGDNKVNREEVQKTYDKADGRDKEQLKKVLDGFDRKQKDGHLDQNTFDELGNTGKGALDTNTGKGALDTKG